MDYKLHDLVDTKRLQQLLDNLYEASGIPSGIIAASGEVITATGWRDICTKFHRVNPITNKRCIESDTSIQLDIDSGKRYVVSHCKNGMVDIASPIIIDGQHLATIFQGQFFFTKPDLSFYRNLAEEVGFPVEAYLNEIEKTPIITEDEIKPVVEFLTDFASFIADLGYSKLKIEKQHANLHEQHEELSAVYEELVATEEELRDNYNLISKRTEELENLNDSLTVANEGYELITEGSYDATWDVDLKTNKFHYSSGISHLTELPYEAIQTNQDFIKLIHPDDATYVHEKFQSALEASDFYMDQYRIITSSGTKWIQIKGKIQRDKGKATRVAGSIGDITEKLKNEKAVKQMAYTDNLTNTYNRNQMYADLNKILDSVKTKGPKNLHVAFLDLDNFKNINDIYGHSTGDSILIQVANRLKQHQDDHTTVYRFGGDEFIFISSQSRDHVMDLSKEILADFTLPFLHNQNSHTLTASIGISSYPIDGMNSDILIKNADTAMYEAKSRGKNQYTRFDISMHEALVERKLLEESLLQALDKHEFVLTYQPIVDIPTGKVSGLEALIRWQKDNKLISPANFIPQAEANGMIKDIDYFVLKSAIRQLIDWRQRDYDFSYISVNVSPAFLMDEHLMHKLEDLIRKYPFNPRDIQIEITENLVIESFELAYSVISTLKVLGFTIAIDDFGVGYSSLRYLKSLPVDVLKVDKYFVDCLSTSDPIIDFIIGMGQRLKLTVVAEGVETEEQLNKLKDFGCDKYQGYFHSKPQMSKNVEELLKKV